MHSGTIKNHQPASGSALFMPGIGSAQFNGGVFTNVGRDNVTVVHNHHGPPLTFDIAAVLDSLPLPNFRKIQIDTYGKATEGTRLWIINGKVFTVWIKDGKILWGVGMPGAGKTVTASIVINHLEKLERDSKGPVCVAYIYIRYSEPLAVRDILEILVKQIFERHQDIAPLVERVYSQHRREGTQPTRNDLLGILADFIKLGKICFFVLDGLDEMAAEARRILVELLASLDAKLFITSRPLQALQRNFPDAVSIDLAARAEDIDLHIKESIRQSVDLQELLEEDEGLMQEVTSAIHKASAGRFLHATLQLDALKQCLSAQDVTETLEQFPEKIESVYAQTWERILRQGARPAKLAKMILLWVIHAKREMSIEELRHAIATSPETYAFEAKRVVNESSLVAACCGLIVVEEESRLVRLVHYTAKDALQPLLINSIPHPHNHITSVCIEHLKQAGFQNTPFRSKTELSNALDSDPLLSYAHSSWHFHAHKTQNLDSTIFDFIVGCQAYPLILFDDDLFKSLEPLQIAAYYGFANFVTPIANHQGRDLQTKGRQSIALALACHRQHESCVKALLSLRDVDVNFAEVAGWTPLMTAAEYGSTGIAKALLEHPDINVNATRAGDYWTALMVASWYGFKAIIRLLLEHPSILVDVEDDEGWTVLMAACEKRQIEAVKALLEDARVDVNAKRDGDGWTALMMASWHGFEDVVKLLLAHPSVLVNEKDKDGWTALRIAAQYGKGRIVTALLDFPNTDANEADPSGWTPLMAAIEHGHIEAVQNLLQHSQTDVNLARDDGFTALTMASWHGFEKIVDLLLEAPSIDVNRANNTGLTPLMVAAFRNHGGVTQTLASNASIDINAVDEDGDSALKLAVNEGLDAIVKILLSTPGIDASIENQNGDTPMSTALKMESQSIIQALRELEQRGGGSGIPR